MRLAARRWIKPDFQGVLWRQRRVKDADAVRTAAIRGFLLRLARLIVERGPARIAVADDADWRPRWRVEQLASDKEHRIAEPVPPGLVPQIPVIDGVLRAIGIDLIGVAG
jgi:5'-3' exonuclease